MGLKETWESIRDKFCEGYSVSEMLEDNLAIAALREVLGIKDYAPETPTNSKLVTDKKEE